ncbi:MAG TPA: FMN-binding glutamate synthase family protein [Algoriphagus sp.]|uniref:FMN-binding glutamate synthase family protein n=2 Tax=Algoriphagus TaxID=246875 RepID=UPI000C5AB820|nr:FMN-binding glutamate synthase family protein [Algoriphagus sp.]QYH38605.1 FMN-binding glutamate synthase family protein [Algoriphagus sp. NBT04N3]MAL11978.1 FMN-binding glutamate synthase family protein [Algoriphagus sp.]HAD50582.1 FMN-binding glutamate synthase family protein [Algoriphagus sp.]HAS57095.1 FMN-binding glutamate synthase family protein [Algoriphagus sp.]HCB47778.1 FMN-binding glutamate synthase family protein [Algoriphagus sp.]
MRKLFFLSILLIFLLTLFLMWFSELREFSFGYFFLIVLGSLTALGIYDSIQKKHAILRNFPVVGHFRYILESISPEIQQYFIESNTDGRPFSRNLRALAYRRAKGVNDTHPFGTQKDIHGEDYIALRHSIYAVSPKEEDLRVTIGTHSCAQPYSASIFNISAMSFGSLSSNAIKALNLGAQKGNFYHNTGEGGISSYHLSGGDLCWQIGTGYFGCRDKDGNFDPESFKEKAQLPEVKLIELKISQGAKPGHGGVLPGIKNTPEIAKIRGLEPGTTVLSPPSHKAFSGPKGMIAFVQQLRELSGGKPVGIKLCIGRTEEFIEICKEMISQECLPDFITIDGAEGGTGAAPLEFSDSVGLPLEPALIFVRAALEKFNLRDKITIIASGKALSAFSILKNIALGADICNSARGFMFSLGCIQALRCNTNDCPTGVATQRRGLVKGLVVPDKAERVYNFHKNTVHAVMELLGASGHYHTSELSVHDLVKGDEMIKLANRYFPDTVNTQV